MFSYFDILDSARFISSLLLSFAFFVGIMLLVSREAFTRFESDLQREYGIKKRFFPHIEQIRNKYLDWFLLRYRYISGLVISITAFVLLLLSR